MFLGFEEIVLDLLWVKKEKNTEQNTETIWVMNKNDYPQNPPNLLPLCPHTQPPTCSSPAVFTVY